MPVYIDSCTGEREYTTYSQKRIRLRGLKTNIIPLMTISNEDMEFELKNHTRVVISAFKIITSTSQCSAPLSH